MRNHSIVYRSEACRLRRSAAFAAAVAVCVMVALSPGSNQGSAAATRTCPITHWLNASCGIWWGVAPGQFTTKSESVALHGFERATGRSVAIVHSYHRGRQLFPTAQEIGIARNQRRPHILFLNWKPEDGHTWRAVAAGAVDGEIDREALYLTTHFSNRFFLTIHHEPENEVRPEAGSGYTAADYRNMFRHVVLRLRSRGMVNAITVMDYIGIPKWGVQSWFGQIYPGDDVVDWIGEDQYTRAEPTYYHGDFAEMVNRTEKRYPGWPGFYTWEVRAHPGKPIMLSEWGLFYWAREPGYADRFLATVLKELPRYPRIRAIVYFDSPNIPPRGYSTSVSSSASSLASFNKYGRLPVFNPPIPRR